MLFARAAQLDPQATYGALQRWIWAWFALSAGWLYLAWLPVPTATQAVLAWSVVVLVASLKRFAERDRILRLIVLWMAAWVSVRYLIWRVTDTLVFPDAFSWLAGMLLFMAEAYGIGIYALGLFVNVYPKHRKSKPLPSDQRLWPTVDVFVPTYNESPELLEITLLGAINMRYADEKKRVYLLDDGGTLQKQNDPDPQRAASARQRAQVLQDLCQRLGVCYLTRERNESAKAGNINTAMTKTDGELIVIFDADHVPTVDFLERTVGEFCTDPKLFLVQTPHFFVNPDPLEHNWGVFGRIPSENDMFYHVIQHGLDAWDASFFCGSAAVLRRSALQSIGGLPGSSVTEDAEISLLLHAQGWRSAYIDRPMVAGLQPETYSSFISQRVRWAQGMMQILLLHNPLLNRGLRWWQRLAYFNSSFFWMFPWARLVFMLAPSAYLVFGLHIYQANLGQFMAYAMPHLFAAMLVSDILYRRVRWAFVSELYELAQSIYAANGIWRVLRNPRAPGFIVTPKGEQRDEDMISAMAKPFYVLILVSVVSLALGVWRWFVEPAERDTIIITMAWQLFNLMLLSGMMGVLFERRQRRLAPRMPLEAGARLENGCGISVSGRFVDVSVTGCRLILDGHFPCSRDDVCVLETWSPALQRRVVIPIAINWQRDPDLVAQFRPTSLIEQRELVALVYGDSNRWAAFRQQREAQARPIFSAAWFLIRHGWVGTMAHASHLALDMLARMRARILGQRRCTVMASKEQ